MSGGGRHSGLEAAWSCRVARLVIAHVSARAIPGCGKARDGTAPRRPFARKQIDIRAGRELFKANRPCNSSLLIGLGRMRYQTKRFNRLSRLTD